MRSGPTQWAQLDDDDDHDHRRKEITDQIMPICRSIYTQLSQRKITQVGYENSDQGKSFIIPCLLHLVIGIGIGKRQ